MKKIPTLFVREFKNHKPVGITSELTDESLSWVLSNDPSINGIATVKWDGSCCMIKDGKLYKRYDAKKGKNPPEGAIPCCDPDPVTGHWPHWVLCNENNPADKWHVEAYKNTFSSEIAYLVADEGTYEAVGPHFQGNPYHLAKDILVRHGMNQVYVNRSFESIKEYLRAHEIEGIVFWKDEEPKCKIKRSDFGFEWPIKEEALNDKQ